MPSMSLLPKLTLLHWDEGRVVDRNSGNEQPWASKVQRSGCRCQTDRFDECVLRT
jgi:hypothetical protein